MWPCVRLIINPEQKRGSPGGVKSFLIEVNTGHADERCSRKFLISSIEEFPWPNCHHLLILINNPVFVQPLSLEDSVH